MIITPNNGFKSAQERLTEEALGRHANSVDGLKTGFEFLDKCLGSITNQDLVMLGAPPGAGKTECLATIAFCNAILGKKVYFYALEAEPTEIERRLNFKSLCHKLPHHRFMYRDFVHGHYNTLIENESIVFDLPPTLMTFYRDNEFGLSVFQKTFASIADKADLIILDHIHYFDLETENENREITSIVKAMRDLVLISKVPIIFAAHLRKGEKKDKPLVADLEDFHGSSNLQKIATKVITLGSGGVSLDGRFITYIRVAKDRINGGVSNYVGRTLFDPKTSSYSDLFEVGQVKRVHGEEKFIPYKTHEVPEWLK